MSLNGLLDFKAKKIWEIHVALKASFGSLEGNGMEWNE
jgi:hypothetical protein